MNKLLTEPSTANFEISDCMQPFTKDYKKGEIIFSATDDFDDIGFVNKGMVCLMSITSDGEKSMLEYYEKNDMFGSRLSPASDINAYYFLAKSPCRITFVKYSRLISCCEKKCEHHIKLIDHLIGVSIRRSQIHIDILSRRTIRDKLLYYFALHCPYNIPVTIPLSLTDLADYLSVDRSAMMRELSRLNSEKIVSSSGRRITLLRQ